MPILIMGLAALAVFLVIGGLLFAAGVSERREASDKPKNSDLNPQERLTN